MLWLIGAVICFCLMGPYALPVLVRFQQGSDGTWRVNSWSYSG